MHEGPDCWPHVAISERTAVLQEANRRGLRAYGMLYPLLPGTAADEGSITELVRFWLSCGAEEVFAEPVNARGSGLGLVQEALHAVGFTSAA